MADIQGPGQGLDEVDQGLLQCLRRTGDLIQNLDLFRIIVLGLGLCLKNGQVIHPDLGPGPGLGLFPKKNK